ncbi:MAG TPA: SpoIID/LytB domain-containing protein, partial [Kofleriaceae bacterium]
KLRILYSTRFTFSDEGLPLVTVEIMGAQREAKLRAKGGITVRPDGAGGAAVEADGGDAWTITAENTKPAVINEWTVVETLSPDDTAGITQAVARWKDRGFDPRSFEIGTVFGVDGEVIDTRETRIAIDPQPAGKGAARATELAKRFGVQASVHQELVRRPSGTIVATSGATVIRNPSVLWFAPKRTGETLGVADVPTNTGGSQLDTGKEDRRYWGEVYVTLDHAGALTAANAVGEDKLLAGLVPAEMYPDSPAAALEAQAIAARTELLQKIGRRNLTDPFLLCSSQQCQVYAGAGKEDPRATRAIEATRGIVVLRDGGGLVDVRYSASCGGHTEDNDAIWGGDPDPSLRGRFDRPGEAGPRSGAEGRRGASIDGPEDNASRADADSLIASDDRDAWCARPKRGKAAFRWTERATIGDLSARVAAEYPGVGRIASLTPGARGSSGRMRSIVIEGDRGRAEVTGDVHIRRLLGGLKSTLFTVARDGDAFVFHGAGFGHGVGMCQMGAIGMAGAGKSHAQILAHYYRGTHLHRLY